MSEKMVKTYARKMKKKKKKKTVKESDQFNLPIDILIQILSKISTKDSIKTSVLSKQWRYLWLHVPVLDIHSSYFEDRFQLNQFVSHFLELTKNNKNLHIKRFNCTCDGGDDMEDDCEIEFTSVISDVLQRSVTHLRLVNHGDAFVLMPISLYSSATLVDISLFRVAFENSKSLVSLPSLKILHLEGVKFNGIEVLETFLSGCVVLEDLCIVANYDDYFQKICVCSQSLRQFKLQFMPKEMGNPDVPNVEIDAPKLVFLSIINYYYGKLIIHSIDPSAKVNLDVVFEEEYFSKQANAARIHQCLRVISNVCELTISARTLKEILKYAEKYVLLPQFLNLSCLHVSCHKSTWKMLISFLECCPNLQLLDLEFESLRTTQKHIPLFLHQPEGFLSTLRTVHLKTKGTTDTTSKKKVASYFISNCKALKTMILDESYSKIIKSVRQIPKRSTAFEGVVIEPAKKVVSHGYSILRDVFVPEIVDDM